jgi:hypothetical protein
VSLDQIKVEVEKTREDGLSIINDMTMEDLVKQPQTWRSRKKEAASKYEEAGGLFSARSFKIYPES